MNLNTANIDTAQREYYRRPKDERLPNVAALVVQAQHQKEASIEKKINAKEITAIPHGNSVALLGNQGTPANLTHWSFGQLARSVGAPASYLRELPPNLAADCLNYGLQNTPPASDFNLLIQAPNGKPEPTIRAATSETYGRVWDADLYGQILNQIMGGGKFILPPTWDGEPAGAYRSDRDSFLIVVDGGSIVSDPSLSRSTFSRPSVPGNANDASPDANAMFRGLMIRNSEVGACSVVIEQILFRYICGNHMLWGAMIDKTFRRKHIGDGTLRAVVREINSIAFNWTNATASRDEAIIRNLITHEIARTREGVVDELKAIGFTKKAAEAAYDACERTEAASPRSYWGIVQGATRASQSDGYQDERYQLDQLAAKVLQRGVKQFATV